MRHWIGEKLRRWADRIDYKGAPKSVGWSFTFERGRGIVFHDSHDKGCGLWYLGDEEYDKAFTGAADRPARVLWQNINEGRRPFVEYPPNCPPGGVVIGRTGPHDDAVPFFVADGDVPLEVVKHFGEALARKLNQ